MHHRHNAGFDRSRETGPHGDHRPQVIWHVAHTCPIRATHASGARVCGYACGVCEGQGGISLSCRHVDDWWGLDVGCMHTSVRVAGWFKSPLRHTRRPMRNAHTPYTNPTAMHPCGVSSFLSEHLQYLSSLACSNGHELMRGACFPPQLGGEEDDAYMPEPLHAGTLC
jgi:hypothetical protein